MDRLWSPWRYRYVTQAAPGPGEANCVFCDKWKSRESGDTSPDNELRDHENFLLYRGRFSYVILNLYPYTSGHLMVIPYDHVAELSVLSPETLAEMMHLAQLTERAFKEVYRCNGVNLGMNLGKAAGAGIAEHLHMHMLPRWFGDVNFMTTIAETRVLPEDLETTYAKLRPMFTANA